MSEGCKEWINKYHDLLVVVAALESELSEYKKCAVVGGDGKPIGAGQERWYWDDGTNQRESFIVESFMVMLQGDTYLNPDTLCIEPDRTYSTPDAVPGGGE